MAARQKELLAKIRGDPEGTQSLFKAGEPMEGHRSALGGLNSPAGVKKLSKDLQSAVDRMAGMERDRGGFNCPTYSEISRSPEDRSARGRSPPAGKMQMGSHMDFGLVGTLPFDAVGGMPAARGGGLRTVSHVAPGGLPCRTCTMITHATPCDTQPHHTYM